MKSLRRSLLFVPAHEERRIEKALGLECDSIILDLEDAVSLDNKGIARSVAASTCASNQDKDIFVRVNSANSGFFDDDIEAAVSSGATAIMLPKCGDMDELNDSLEKISSLCIRNSVQLEVFALLESALGIANLKRICRRSQPTLQGICFGHADFSLDMGLDDNDSCQGAVLHARSSIPVNAKAFGKTPIDTVCLEFKSVEMMEQDIQLGISLGFEGKLCIHPSQVPIVNRMYTPSEKEIIYATNLLQAWEEAISKGLSVMSYENKMVDAPVVRQQEKILERARKAGIVDD